MDVESKETMDKHDIILNGINELKATNRYKRLFTFYQALQSEMMENVIILQ